MYKHTELKTQFTIIFLIILIRPFLEILCFFTILYTLDFNKPLYSDYNTVHVFWYSDHTESQI